MTPAPDTRPLPAALSMLAAMTIIGVIDSVIVLLAAQIGLWQFHLLRALLALPVIYALSLLGFGRFLPVRVWAVAGRSVLVALAMLFYFSALALMPIAQALAGLFTSPIFILLINAATGQRIGPWRVLAVAIGFVGILLVLELGPANITWLGVMPVAAGFFYALGALSTRHWCSGESTVAMLAGMMTVLGCIGALGLVVMALADPPSAAGPAGFVTRGWVWPMWEAAPWLGVQVLGSVAGVFLIIRAYQLGEAAQVSVFEYSVMITGPVFAFLAFGQTVGPSQIAGIACIALAGIVIALRGR